MKYIVESNSKVFLGARLPQLIVPLDPDISHPVEHPQYGLGNGIFCLGSIIGVPVNEALIITLFAVIGPLLNTMIS